MRGRAYGAAAASALIWGLSFLFTKRALGVLTTFQLLGGRFLLAAGSMVLLAALRVIRVNLTWPKLKLLLPVALLQPIVYFLCETAGVRLVTTAEAGIMIALVPVAVSLCAALLLGERLRPLHWASVLLSVAGAAVMAAQGLGGQGGNRLLGYLALLGAVVAAGLFNPLVKRASAVATSVETTFVMMAVGAVVFPAVGVVQAAAAGEVGAFFAGMFPREAIGSLVYLGVVSSVLAFLCQNWAIARLSPSVVGTFVNLTPVVTVLAGVLANGERLATLQYVGAALIFVGIWGATRGHGKAAAAQAAEAPADTGLPG